MIIVIIKGNSAFIEEICFKNDIVLKTHGVNNSAGCSSIIMFWLNSGSQIFCNATRGEDMVVLATEKMHKVSSDWMGI